MTEKNEKSQNLCKKKISDENLWLLATSDVSPLKNKNKTIKQTGKKIIKSPPTIKPEQKTKTFRNNTTSTEDSKQIDRSTREKLRRGKREIEGTLDLHGLTKIQAHETLEKFILRAHSQKKRCVLIITGKGTQRSTETQKNQTHTGVLKRIVPEWLREKPLNSIVLAIETAKPQHGGEGAIYVLLRRTREQN